MQDRKNLHRLRFTDEEKGAPRLRERPTVQETAPEAPASGAAKGTKRPHQPPPRDGARPPAQPAGQEPARPAERTTVPTVNGEQSKPRLRFDDDPQPASSSTGTKRPQQTLHSDLDKAVARLASTSDGEQSRPRLHFDDDPQQASTPMGTKRPKQPMRPNMEKASTQEPAWVAEQPKTVPRPALSPDSKQPKAHLCFDEGRKSVSRPKLARDPKRPVVTAAHRKIEEVEDDNVGVESAHAGEIAAEDSVHRVRATYRSRKERLKKRSRREQGSKQETTKPTSLNGHSNPISRRFQRRNIQKQYAAARRGGGTVSGSAASVGQTARRTTKTGAKASAFVSRHKRGFIWIAVGFLAAAFFMNVFSSCSVLVESTTGALAATSYPCSEEDLLGAEAAYCALEQELQTYLDEYETTHEYDVYRYDLDEIKHDPYVLLSYLSAWVGGPWTLDEVQDILQMIFDRQYILTESEFTEDGRSVCFVALENFDLSHLPIYTMSEEQMGMYALYMSTLGNRPDMFPDSEYVGKYYGDDTPEYELPPEALEDEVFARMMTEAQKYIGYPYVWGGYQPSTSFDCSGFVSWVINHSGWNYGRLGATALYYVGTPISAEEARPGDLVFFEGTYDTDGMSHCGIYVGNGMMIHAGDPIGYANLNLPYWQAHLAGFCRLPATGG